jgi:hypothetical protein
MSKSSNLLAVASYRRFHPASFDIHIPTIDDVISLTVMSWRSGAPYFVSVVETLIHLDCMMCRGELVLHDGNWKTTLLSMMDVTQSMHTDGLPLDRVNELWMSCGISSTEMDCRLLWCNEVRQWLSMQKNEVSMEEYEKMLWNITRA